MPETLRRPTRFRAFLWIDGLSLGLVILLFVLWSVRMPPLPPLPRPNGFDDLARAGREIAGVPPEIDDIEKSDAETLRGLVEPNQGPLRLAREALARPSRVPIDFTVETLLAHMHQMMGLRNLGRLLFAEGALAEKEGRTSDAAGVYVDLVRVGQHGSRGGVMIDSLFGQAIEATGVRGLAGIRARLDADQVRQLLPKLAEIDRARESVPTIMANERLWQRRTVPLYEKAMLSLSGTGRKQMQPAITGLEMAHHRQQARLRLLMTDLALRAYFFDHQAYPDHLADLVPAYLDSVPIDPYNGREPTYRKGASDFLLYAVGPDGQDDGGRPLPEKVIPAKARGDILVDPGPDHL